MKSRHAKYRRMYLYDSQNTSNNIKIIHKLINENLNLKLRIKYLEKENYRLKSKAIQYTISILSEQDVLNYNALIHNTKNTRWLKDGALNSNHQKCINEKNDVSFWCPHICEESEDIYVQPTLTICNPEKVYKVGKVIPIGNFKWTVLRSTKDETYVVCNSTIAKRKYDYSSNLWETSNLKHWLENEGMNIIFN